MKFTIVMPSYLGYYKSAAKNREEKLRRAIRSVITQSYKNWELNVVCDGCQKSVEIAEEFEDERINIFYIKKQPIWSGLVRNVGVKNASGDWVCYLDTDDMFGVDHLKKIAEQVNDSVDWVWFNDRSWDERLQRFNEQGRELVFTQCGTSNICHRPDLCGWPVKGSYKHDWKFIINLRTSSGNYKKIKTPEYLICHVPGLLDYEGQSKEI